MTTTDTVYRRLRYATRLIQRNGRIVLADPPPPPWTDVQKRFILSAVLTAKEQADELRMKDGEER